MASRLGLGPVFQVECITASRRVTTYAARTALALALLIGMAAIWWNRTEPFRGPGPVSYRALAQLGEGYFYAIVGVQLALVMLAAPASAAGAICVDRARGTLYHLLMTDLTDPEVALGKLAGRLAPTFTLIACAWPVMALASLLGGLDPLALTWAVAVTLAVALLGCAAALTLSIWVTKAQEAAMLVYAAWAGLLLAYPIWLMMSRSTGIGGPPAWVLLLNPFYVAFAPYAVPGRLGWADYAAFFGAALGCSALLAALAVARVRAVSLRLAGEAPRKRPRSEVMTLAGRLTRVLPGPSLDGNPVLWREWHRNRATRWTRIVWGVYVLAAVLATGWGIGDLIAHGTSGAGGNGIIAAYAFLCQLLFGQLLLSATAATSLAEERQRGSLDVLLATPLSTRSIVWGKWWGTARLTVLLAIGPTAIALAFACCHVPPPRLPPGLVVPLNAFREIARFPMASLVAAMVLAHGLAIASVGLAAATWCRRQGRAMGISVAYYVLVAVGWPILIMSLSFRGGPNSPAGYVAMLSPIFGGVNLLESLAFPGREWMPLVIFGTIWTTVVALGAWGLFELTVASFDRRLGRVPERPGPPEFAARPGPPKEPKRLQAAEAFLLD